MTLQVRVFFLTFAVILALPAFLALIFPVLLTVAIFLLDVFHVARLEVPFTLSV